MKGKVNIQSYHKLKILPENFEPIAKGIKNFDIRKNDRNYKVGDKIVLKEHTGKNFTGKEVVGRIRYLTDYEQKEGYVVFSFKKLSINSDGRVY